MAEQKAKEFKGPGSGRMRGPRPKVKDPGKLFRRIMGEIMEYYKLQMVLVIACIITSVLCNAQGTLFIQSLIDNYIEPMLISGSNDYSGLASAICRVAVFYAIGAG